MYNKILVPLDGSPLAEIALPYAVKLANQFKSDLIVLRVAHLPALVNDTLNHELAVIKEAETYLEQIQKHLTPTYAKTRIEPERLHTIVAYGNPVEEITALAPFEKADLIVMTTHGRSGLSGFVTGSVAAKIVKQARVPVLLIHPDSDRLAFENSVNFNLRKSVPKVLVTLDGTLEAEAALKPAIDLARQLRATVYLMRVVVPVIPLDSSYQLYGLAYDPVKETARLRREAYEYLSQIQPTVEREGLNCVKVVRVGRPAEEVVHWAKEAQATMLVMATHARSKVGRLFMGSVAEEVVKKSHLPVLLVRTPHLTGTPQESVQSTVSTS